MCQQISDDGQLGSFAKQTSFSAASTSSSSRTLLATFLGICGLLDRCRSNISPRQLRVTRSRNDQQAPWPAGTAAAHGHPAVQRVFCPACLAQQKLDFAGNLAEREILQAFASRVHASVSVFICIQMCIMERISERSVLLFVLHFKLQQCEFLLHEIYLAASYVEGQLWTVASIIVTCVYCSTHVQQCAFRHVPRTCALWWVPAPHVSSQHLQQQSIVLDRSVWSVRYTCVKPFAERQVLGAMIV